MMQRSREGRTSNGKARLWWTVLGCAALLAVPVWFGLELYTDHRRQEQVRILQSTKNLHDISSIVLRRALQKG